MKITLLGTGGYFPNRRRHTACLMIPEIGVVLDAGTAAYQIQQHLETESLDIFLSHAHLDHVFGLTCLLNLFDGQGARRIRVHGEPEKLEVVEQCLFNKLLFPVAPPCTFTPLADSVALPQGGRLTWFPLEHPGGSVGYRLDWPATDTEPARSLAYVTDTIARPDAAYLEHIQGVELLVHEAYFNDDERDWAELTGHSCATDVAQNAAAAGAKQLVMVHMNPMCESDQPLDLAMAREAFAELVVAEDGMVVEF
ncbi:ribonuclease Z [Posidoniimonas polymericola]|uniref:Ribonuclease Z n=1 Tax=Posidoniimonas polymericola TaxID=2528002 RepID=A0A5C5ZEN0_9BACT|nr:MBL fold metallo-hydrolase [Posidoniimonas polymericola]TWT85590.1 ribonuclease Z [Posidoniimonas polymericola]